MSSLPGATYTEHSMATAGKTAVTADSGPQAGNYARVRNIQSRIRASVLREVDLPLAGVSALPGGTHTEHSMATSGKTAVTADSGPQAGNYARVYQIVLALDLRNIPPLVSASGRRIHRGGGKSNKPRFFWVPLVRAGIDFTGHGLCRRAFGSLTVQEQLDLDGFTQQAFGTATFGFDIGLAGFTPRAFGTLGVQEQIAPAGFTRQAFGLPTLDAAVRPDGFTQQGFGSLRVNFGVFLAGLTQRAFGRHRSATICTSMVSLARASATQPSRESSGSRVHPTGVRHRPSPSACRSTSSAAGSGAGRSACWQPRAVCSSSRFTSAARSVALTLRS